MPPSPEAHPTNERAPLQQIHQDSPITIGLDSKIRNSTGCPATSPGRHLSAAPCLYATPCLSATSRPRSCRPLPGTCSPAPKLHRHLDLEQGGGPPQYSLPDAQDHLQQTMAAAGVVNADHGTFAPRLPDASAMSLVPGGGGGSVVVGVIRLPGVPVARVVGGSCVSGDRVPLSFSPPEEYGPRGRMVASHVARRVSVITEQPRITRSLMESVKSQNGGDVSGYYNSHQTSPYKQVCGGSVVNDVEGLTQECSVDYSVVHGGNSSVLGEELSRKVHNRGLVTNVPRTNTTTHTSVVAVH